MWLIGAYRWLSTSCSFVCSLDITCQPSITLLIFIITTTCAILDLAFFDGYRLVQKSASDFWSFISMSSSDRDPQPSPPPESAVKTGVSLLPWPETRKSDTGSASEWERFPHPKELEYLPDDLQTSYELRQIVKRSLYRHEPESSSSRQVEPQVERQVEHHESQSDPDPKSLPVGPQKQHRESFGSTCSFATGSDTSETRSTAPKKDPPPLPSPSIIPRPKSRELKPKSSFLAFKMDRLGAKIEKLEFMSSKRSLRSLEEKKIVATA